MKINKFIVSIIFLFTLNLAYGQNKIDKIEMSYVNWSIHTFSLVNCEEFDEAFNIDGIKKNYSITEPLIIDAIEHKVLKIVQDQRLNDYDAVDTRLKMRFYSNNELITVVCIGTISIQINNIVYSGIVDADFEVEKLRNLLDKINALYTSLNQDMD